MPGSPTITIATYRVQNGNGMPDQSQFPNQGQASYRVNVSAAASPALTKFHGGVRYDFYLKHIHDTHKPKGYLEIGVETGATLAFAQCPAVAVDPRFQLQGNPIGPRAETYLFQMTSDAFFAKHDLTRFLSAGVDFAFLDGMHRFEYLLRDLLNTEKYAHRDTIVALHDCYPVNSEIADRDTNYHRRTNAATRAWWAGDVWKLLPILRDYRPDLKLTILDCPPTGLVIVRGFKSGAERTIDAEEISAAYGNVTLDDFGIERFRTEFPTVDSKSFPV
jgi:hypothetical protein